MHDHHAALCHSTYVVSFAYVTAVPLKLALPLSVHMFASFIFTRNKVQQIIYYNYIISNFVIKIKVFHPVKMSDDENIPTRPKRTVKRHLQHEYLIAKEDSDTLPFPIFYIEPIMYYTIMSQFNDYVHRVFNPTGHRKLRFMPPTAFGRTPPPVFTRNYDALCYLVNNPHRTLPETFLVVAYYGENKLSYKPNHQSIINYVGEEIDHTILQGVNIFSLHSQIDLPKWMINGLRSLQISSDPQFAQIKWCFIHVRLDFRQRDINASPSKYNTADVMDDIFSLGTMVEAMLRHIKKACPTRDIFTIISESVIKWKSPALSNLADDICTPEEYKDTYIRRNFYDFSRSSAPGAAIYPLQHFVRFHPQRLTSSDDPKDQVIPPACLDDFVDTPDSIIQSISAFFASEVSQSKDYNIISIPFNII